MLVGIPREAAMKRFQRSLFRLVVASAGCAWLVMACNAQPGAVGNGEGGAVGPAVGGAGAGPSNAGGSTEGGTTGGSFPPLPDAAIVYEDVLPDSVTASGEGNCGAVQNKIVFEKKIAVKIRELYALQP